MGHYVTVYTVQSVLVAYSSYFSKVLDASDTVDLSVYTDTYNVTPSVLRALYTGNLTNDHGSDESATFLANAWCVANFLGINGISDAIYDYWQDDVAFPTLLRALSAVHFTFRSDAKLKKTAADLAAQLLMIIMDQVVDMLNDRKPNADLPDAISSLVKKLVDMPAKWLISTIENGYTHVYETTAMARLLLELATILRELSDEKVSATSWGHGNLRRAFSTLHWAHVHPSVLYPLLSSPLLDHASAPITGLDVAKAINVQNLLAPQLCDEETTQTLSEAALPWFKVHCHPRALDAPFMVESAAVRVSGTFNRVTLSGMIPVEARYPYEALQWKAVRAEWFFTPLNGSSTVLSELEVKAMRLELQTTSAGPTEKIRIPADELVIELETCGDQDNRIKVTVRCTEMPPHLRVVAVGVDLHWHRDIATGSTSATEAKAVIVGFPTTAAIVDVYLAHLGPDIQNWFRHALGFPTPAPPGQDEFPDEGKTEERGEAPGIASAPAPRDGPDSDSEQTAPPAKRARHE